jgi:hypothetical protein
MNSQAPVINALGDYEETIRQLAKHLGRDKNRRAVFNLIYGRGSKPRSKKQIAEALGIEGNAQVIQNALDELARYHLIVRIENKGQVKDGSRWLYQKESSVRAHRERIVHYADNPSAAKKIATKRTPIVGLVSFVKAGPPLRAARRPKVFRKPHEKAKLRIAFLASNPSDEGRIRTDIELKAVKRAINASGNRESVHLEPFTAASFSDLLRALNEYQAHVVHFSGHGGSASLSFDSEGDLDTGSNQLDFSLINEVITAIDDPPAMLVFNACDTLKGAEVFTQTVSAVVAMSDSIGDLAAVVFAPTFYAALSAGQSVKSALAQGKAMLKAQAVGDEDLPTLLLKDGVDAGNLKFA